MQKIGVWEWVVILEFLLKFNGNYDSLLHRFQDAATVLDWQTYYHIIVCTTYSVER